MPRSWRAFEGLLSHFMSAYSPSFDRSANGRYNVQRCSLLMITGCLLSLLIGKEHSNAEAVLMSAVEDMRVQRLR